LPNVPHLALETLGNFAKAKVKETILAVTGGWRTTALRRETGPAAGCRRAAAENRAR